MLEYLAEEFICKDVSFCGASISFMSSMCVYAEDSSTTDFELMLPQVPFLSFEVGATPTRPAKAQPAPFQRNKVCRVRAGIAWTCVPMVHCFPVMRWDLSIPPLVSPPPPHGSRAHRMVLRAVVLIFAWGQRARSQSTLCARRGLGCARRPARLTFIGLDRGRRTSLVACIHQFGQHWTGKL